MTSTTPTAARSTGYKFSEVPPFVQYVSPVPGRPSKTTSSTLPLGILVLIFSHLHDPGDLARVVRTSRLFRYVALPQLYERVSLEARSHIKYVDGRPQGFGGGSPFGMALNGLATQDYVSYVKELRIGGQIDEPGNDDFAKGRVPDTTTLLNTVLRIVVDRASRLEGMVWDLASMPTKTFYQGLSSKQTLTRLTLRTSSARIPRPTIIIPPMPKLRELRVLDMDPLCYPDDLSLLLLHSRQLQDLRLHFSPRMRSQAEPIVMLRDIFQRCFANNYTPRLTHLAIQNYFGRYFDSMMRLYDTDTLTSYCFLDMFGGTRSTGSNIFIDDSWRDLPKELVCTAKSLRFNEPAPQHVKMLVGATTKLERFYFVNDSIKSPVNTPGTLATPGTSPGEDSEAISLGREYIHALTRFHGESLKHLLLCDQWLLTPQDIGDIVRFCPNVEQLAIALDDTTFDVFRIVVQFLPNLYACRLFDNEQFWREREQYSREERLLMFGRDLYRFDCNRMRYCGAGPDAAELVGPSTIVLEDGTTEVVMGLKYLTFDEMRHVPIWGMDTLDIMYESSYASRIP